MMKKIGIKSLKCITFTAIVIVIFCYLSKIFVNCEDYRISQWLSSFHSEEEGKLDAVYIGSSNVYSSWNSLAAWENYGIAVHPYSTPSQRLIFAKYIIEDARQTQPDALYIINISHIQSTMKNIFIHRLTDNMSLLSKNRWEMINNICDYYDLDKLEFLFPMYLYHNRWNSLDDEDFNPGDGYKGSPHFYSYLKVALDSSKDFHRTDKSIPLVKQEYYHAFNELIDYIKKNNVKVLFVNTVQAIDTTKLAKLNYLCDTLEEQGFDVLDMYDHYDELGLDLKKDYYNHRHTNIHGSMKLTKFLSEYLIENYGFKDKRNDPAYKDWNEEWDKYLPLIQDYVKEKEYTFTSKK